jgi:hypothetical protein
VKISLRQVWPHVCHASAGSKQAPSFSCKRCHVSGRDALSYARVDCSLLKALHSSVTRRSTGTVEDFLDHGCQDNAVIDWRDVRK